jgi:hypothetical protein
MGARQKRVPYIGRVTQAQCSPACATAAKLVEHLPPICTVADAAKMLRCSPRNIRRWLATGRLQSFRVVQAQQARVLIPRTSIESLIAESLG